MVPVSARALAGLPLMLIVNSSAWNGLSFGMPSVVIYVLAEPLPASCSLLSVSGSYSPSLLSGLSSERRTWLVLTSFSGHSVAMCPLSPQ